MADNTLPKIGGIASIVATILLAIVGIFAPNTETWGTLGTRQFYINALNYINGYDLWAPVYSILVVLFVLLSFTVAALYKTFRDRGEETFSMIAFVASILAASASTVSFAIHGFALPVLARAYGSAVTEVSKEAALITFQYAISADIPITVFIVPLLLWSTFGFIGMAAIRTRVFPRWLGYLGIALGVAMWLDWPLAIIFIPTSPTPLILAARTGQLFVTAFWLITVGAYMLKLR